MPVSYRAGTDVSHAHSFFQFLSDAAAGSMDHHRRWHARRTTGHGQARAEPPQRVSPAVSGGPVLEPLSGALERARAYGLVLLLAVIVLGAGKPIANDQSRRLTGIDVRPLVPPPRGVAFGV